MKDRGSALLTSVISILILTLVSGVLFTVALSYAKVESSEEKGIIVYHMAEAGVQYGIAAILDAEAVDEATEENEEEIDVEPSSLELILGTSERIIDTLYSDGEILVEWIDNTGSIIVRSTATYNGVTRIKEAEYLLLDEDENEEDDDGNDDDDEENPDECPDDGPVPNYPAWDPLIDYPSTTYVTYNGRAFYNRYYVDRGVVPGTLNRPWQEITNQWRNFNVYNKDDEVCYNGQRYRAKWYTSNQTPGDPYGPWELID